MQISNAVIFFVIVGLATCSADRCSSPEMGQAILSCTMSMTNSIQSAGEDHGKICSALKTVKSCFADATNGCDSAAASSMNQALAPFKNLESQCSGYSHASSTSVVNIALLIAGTATFVPFL